MKNVDIIMSASLNSSIGPVQTIKRVKNSMSWFEERGYSLNVFTNDAIAATKEEDFKKNFKGSFILNIVVQFAKFLSLHTKWYPRNRIKTIEALSKKVLDYYDSLHRHPDIIVFHSMNDCREYLKHHRIKGVKTICFHHTDGSEEGNKMLLVYFPKLRGTKTEKKMDEDILYTVTNIDALACITKVEEKNMLSQFPVLKGKTFQVVNGISDLSKEQLEETNLIRIKTNEKKYRLVSVGSMNGRKGHLEVVEAVNKMNPEIRKEVSVTFVGGGRDKEKLQSLVKKYGLQDTFNFVGIIPNDEVYKFQAQGNICILISKIEGLPLGLIEGLRSGLALISTNVSGIPELIDEGVNGRLINYDLDELVDVLNHLDQYDWDEMGKKSREKFDVFYNFPRMRNDYLSMLNKVSNS